MSRQKSTEGKAHPATAPSPQASVRIQAPSLNREHASRSTRRSTSTLLSTLPEPLGVYLDTYDDDEAHALLPVVANKLNASEARVLIDLFRMNQESERADRILGLLSNLSSASALDVAVDVVHDHDIAMDDPVLLACAKSLSSHPDKSSIEVILSRLNESPLHAESGDSQNIPPLGILLSGIADPSMEYFIGQAALGSWAASSEMTRATAIHTLMNYPNHRSTTILSGIASHDPSPMLRNLASKTLAKIRTLPDGFKNG